jgi:hypothetical protein
MDMTDDKAAKKVSLADAAKALLAQKKQAANSNKSGPKNQNTTVQTMKSQINKKPNNQTRRTGGS